METRPIVERNVGVFVRCFVATTPLTFKKHGAIVNVYPIDKENCNRLNPYKVKSIPVDDEGRVDFTWPDGEEVTLEVQAQNYHTVQTGIITVTRDITDPKRRDMEISFQVPSLRAIQAFAYYMNGTLNHNGKAQAVVATIAVLGKTMNHLPQGMWGAKVKLEFLDENIQKQWLACHALDEANKRHNDNLRLYSLFASLLTAYAAWHRWRNILLSVGVLGASYKISSSIAWKFLNKTFYEFYFDVWRTFIIAYKTSPFNSGLVVTSPDGGALFNLKDVVLPKDGARFRLVTTHPDGHPFTIWEGLAFPDKLTNLSPPCCPTALVRPLRQHRFQYGEMVEDEGIRLRIALYALGFAVVKGGGFFAGTRNKVLSVILGALTAIALWKYLAHHETKKCAAKDTDLKMTDEEVQREIELAKSWCAYRG